MPDISGLHLKALTHPPTPSPSPAGFIPIPPPHFPPCRLVPDLSGLHLKAQEAREAAEHAAAVGDTEGDSAGMSVEEATRALKSAELEIEVSSFCSVWWWWGDGLGVGGWVGLVWGGEGGGSDDSVRKRHGC